LALPIIQVLDQPPFEVYIVYSLILHDDYLRDPSVVKILLDWEVADSHCSVESSSVICVAFQAKTHKSLVWPMLFALRINMHIEKSLTIDKPETINTAAAPFLIIGR